MILVRASVATCSPIETRLIRPTVIEIFVAELTTPVGLTEALPGLHAGTMHTAWVGDALVTVQSLPAILATAVTWLFARSMHGTTALSANSCVAVSAHPAFHASFVAVLVTGIVSKEVISWSAELVASKTIVVLITNHTNLILKVSYPCILLQRLPLAARVDHTRVRSLFNNVVKLVSVIAEIPCLHQQSVGPRPGEAERQHDAVALVAAATALQAEGVAPEDGRGARTEAAGAPGRDAGLVLLEAHFEVRVALVASALALRRAPRAAAAAVAVLQLPVGVVHGQDLQLELARGPTHLGSQSPEKSEQEAQGAPGPAARP